MQVSTNNTATFFCYTAPIPSPTYIGENFGYYCQDIRKSNSASIVIISPNEVILNNRIISLLNEVSYLQDNWDEESAIAPSKNTIKKAYSLVYMLEKQSQQIFNLAPGPNGEIMLDIRNSKKTKSFEIILYNHKSIVVKFPENNKPSQGNFFENEIPNLLSWLDQK